MTTTKRTFACGILHLTSRLSYEREGKHYKPFTLFDRSRELIVRGKKMTGSKDIYAVVNLSDKSDMATIEQYIGEVGDSKAEREYLKLCCTVTWCNNNHKELGDNPDLYISERVDLVGPDIYTIDPPGCIDIDDAIHVKLLDSGNIDIGIHIADVTSYIPGGTPLDIELAHRGQSVYLLHEQINMIPPKLVKKYSLTADQPKNTFSVCVEMEPTGRIVQVSFRRYRITIKENLSYDQADRIRETVLGQMFQTGQKLWESFGRTGEYNIHTMVEAYMVLANSMVAEKIVGNRRQILVRRHTGYRKELYKPKPDDNPLVLDLISRANLLLSNKAEYSTSPTDCSHIGLNLTHYTHFTSPIRRYADILVHRLLTTPDSKIPDPLVNHLNEIGTRYHRCEKLSIQLDKIYLLKKSYGDVFEATGYAVDIEWNGKASVKSYIKDSDFYTESIILDPKLSHLVTVDLKPDGIILTNIKSGKRIYLNIFQKVRLKFAVTLGGRRKLISKIIDPDIMGVFDVADLDTETEPDYDIF